MPSIVPNYPLPRLRFFTSVNEDYFVAPVLEVSGSLCASIVQVLVLAARGTGAVSVRFVGSWRSPRGWTIVPPSHQEVGRQRSRFGFPKE
jgi:hypothetical protein